MPEDIQAEQAKILNHATVILNHLDLIWEDLEGKSILDLGCGGADLSHATALKNIPTSVISIDIERKHNWLDLPQSVRKNIVQADAEKLPFEDNQFDFIIANGSVSPIQCQDAVRVLKPGGELRISPIGGQLLEYWFISYYLDKYENFDQEEVNAIISGFDRQINVENDGWVPNDYINLRDKVLDNLSPAEKCGLIDMLVQSYCQVTEIPFEYTIFDHEAYEPSGVMIYSKPILI